MKFYGYDYKFVRKALTGSVFSHMLSRKTPFDVILNYERLSKEATNTNDEVIGMREMCDNLNKYRKKVEVQTARNERRNENKRMKFAEPRLTFETLVDLKPFGLMIGWFSMQICNISIHNFAFCFIQRKDKI